MLLGLLLHTSRVHWRWPSLSCGGSLDLLLNAQAMVSSIGVGSHGYIGHWICIIVPTIVQVHVRASAVVVAALLVAAATANSTVIGRHGFRWRVVANRGRP